MNAANTVLLVNASLTLLQELIPTLAQAKADGKITPEQQAEVLASYNSLKAKADGQFSGPEWELSGR